VFYVGASADSAGRKALDRRGDWDAQVDAKDLQILHDDVVATYGAVQLTEFRTLSQQGERLADWAVDRVRAILELKPPALRR
jgi:hypothetical protein